MVFVVDRTFRNYLNFKSLVEKDGAILLIDLPARSEQMEN